MNASTTELLPTGADVRDLLGHYDLVSSELARRIQELKPPGAGQAQVLRFVSFQRDQIVAYKERAQTAAVLRSVQIDCLAVGVSSVGHKNPLWVARQ